MPDLLKAASRDLLRRRGSRPSADGLSTRLEHKGRAPAIDLARAERRIPRSPIQRGRLLAVEAARQRLPNDDRPFASDAYSAAGHSAHLATARTGRFSITGTQSNFPQPRPTQGRPVGTASYVRWIFEDADAQEALARLESTGAENDDDQVRLATGPPLRCPQARNRTQPWTRRRSPRPGRHEPHDQILLLERVGFALAFAAHYEDALEASEEQIAEAKRYRLSFALPQAYLTRATVCRGLRAFDEAGSWLDKAERAALSSR